MFFSVLSNQYSPDLRPKGVGSRLQLLCVLTCGSLSGVLRGKAAIPLKDCIVGAADFVKECQQISSVCYECGVAEALKRLTNEFCGSWYLIPFFMPQLFPVEQVIVHGIEHQEIIIRETLSDIDILPIGEDCESSH
jgi:hypothetical protein